jgi:hypothetical protein
MRLSRISRNSFGPLRSLRLRVWRSSSLADGSIRRSNAWPAISRAFAAHLGRALAWCAGGVQCGYDRLAVIAYDIGGVVVVLAPAGSTSKIIFCVFSQVGHQAEGKRCSVSNALALLAFDLHLCSGVRTRETPPRGSGAPWPCFSCLPSRGP